MDKHSQLLDLAGKRKRTRWNGFNCIGDYHDGAFECDFVSPYTRSAHNVDSDIMVILQDWSSDSVLSAESATHDPIAMKLGHNPHLKTNKKLIRLLNDHFGVGLKDIYATNLFPFIKLGGISAKIPLRDLRHAAEEFALLQIKIVSPKLVVCLGVDTFKAICLASGKEPPNTLALAIESPFRVGGSLIWCQAHPGGRASNRSGDQVSSDWSRMANAIFPAKAGRAAIQRVARESGNFIEQNDTIRPMRRHRSVKAAPDRHWSDENTKSVQTTRVNREITPHVLETAKKLFNNGEPLVDNGESVVSIKGLSKEQVKALRKEYLALGRALTQLGISRKNTDENKNWDFLTIRRGVAEGGLVFSLHRKR